MESEIKISKKELRILSVRFRTVASRLLKTRFNEGMSNLKRFINFIEKDLIIYDFIQKQQQQSKIFDIESILNFSDIELTVPDEREEDEIAFTYQLLKYGLKKYQDDSYGYAWLAKVAYEGKNFQEPVDLFNRNVVQPFVFYIENNLTKLQLDMGEDEQAKIHIQVYGNNSGDIMSSANNQSKSVNYSFGNSKWGGGFAADGGIQHGGTLNDLSQNYTSEQKQTLAEAAKEIQQLLKQLEETNPTATEADKKAFLTAAISPTRKERFLSALQACGRAALEEFLDNPYINVALATAEGWQNP